MGNDSDDGQHAAAFEHGELVPIESDRDRSAKIQKYCQAFHASEQTALENIEWFEENWTPPRESDASVNEQRYRFILFQLAKELLLLPRERDALFFGIKRAI